MGIHFPQKGFRARRRGHSRSNFARAAQPYLLAFLVALPVIFCALLLWDRGFSRRSGFGDTSPQSWMLGGREAIAPVDSSAEVTDQVAHFGALDTNRAATRFSLCRTGGGANCVVDGDTFWSNGQKIRIADIDTPETHPARCAAEAELGNRATRRLQELLSAGAFTLISIDRDADKYGRKLRVVERKGSSIGGQLVNEGLARPYAGGYREGWCA